MSRPPLILRAHPGCVLVLCCQLAYANPGTVKFSLPVPVKSTGVQLILVLPQTEKSWKIWLTEYSIRVSPCMHEMQRGTRLACMLVWAGQLSQRSCWQPNMPEWRRDAAPPGPSAGHKPPCVSNGQHVCSAKPKVHQKCPDSNRRYWAVSNSALWQCTRIKTPQNLVCLLIFVLINKIGRPHQNCSMSLLSYSWGTLFRSVKLKNKLDR